MTEIRLPEGQLARCPEHGTAITLVLPPAGDVGELRERVTAVERALADAEARIEALSTALAAAVAAAPPAPAPSGAVDPAPPRAAAVAAPFASLKSRGLRRMIAVLTNR